MNLQWYIRQGEADVEKGPFERQALVDAALRGGGLRFDTPVRREDQAEWSTLGEHPAFRAGLAGWRPGATEDDEIPGVDPLSRLAFGQKWWMNAKATAALRRGGYVVGFFGPKKKQG